MTQALLIQSPDWQTRYSPLWNWKLTTEEVICCVTFFSHLFFGAEFFVKFNSLQKLSGVCKKSLVRLKNGVA